MCLNKYKGLLRSAVALAIRLLEVTPKTPNTREYVIDQVATYLNDNDILADFSVEHHRALVIKIVRAGEEVYFKYRTLDKALERLSRSLQINLVERTDLTSFTVEMKEFDI